MQKSKDYQGKCNDSTEFPSNIILFNDFACFSMLYPHAAHTAIYEDIGLAEPRILGKSRNF